MKPLAPSKRLKMNLAALTKNLCFLCSTSHIASIRDHYNPHGDFGSSHIKEADSLLVFTPCFQRNAGYDFAICFDWVGKEPGDMTAEVRIRPHVKDAAWNDHLTEIACDLNKRIVTSPKMSIDDFRQKLNLMVSLTAPFYDKTLAKKSEGNKISEWSDLIDIVKNVFEFDESDLEMHRDDQRLLLEAQQKGEQCLAMANEAVEKAKLAYEQANKNYLGAVSAVNADVKALPEVAALTELEKKVAELKKTIAAATNKINEQRETSKLKEDVERLHEQYLREQRAKKRSMSNFIRDVPAYIALKLEL